MNIIEENSLLTRDDDNERTTNKPERRPQHFVTVDILVFHPLTQQILLIKRFKPAYEGKWALPGGHVEEETLEQAAERELREETNIKGIPLRQLQTFGDPGRDPRGHYVSVLYLGISDDTELPNVCAGDDAGDVEWFALAALPSLAFDHGDMIAFASPLLPPVQRPASPYASQDSPYPLLTAWYYGRLHTPWYEERIAQFTLEPTLTPRRAGELATAILSVRCNDEYARLELDVREALKLHYDPFVPNPLVKFCDALQCLEPFNRLLVDMSGTHSFCSDVDNILRAREKTNE